MDSILITPKNYEEMQLITGIFNKMKIKSRVFSDEEKEDLGLALLMKESDRAKKVSREEIFEILG